MVRYYTLVIKQNEEKKEVLHEDNCVIALYNYKQYLKRVISVLKENKL